MDVPKKEDEKDTIIRGLIAYKGHVTPAKIILVESDMVKLVEGMLVSSATNPDLILAMKSIGICYGHGVLLYRL